MCCCRDLVLAVEAGDGGTLTVGFDGDLADIGRAAPAFGGPEALDLMRTRGQAVATIAAVVIVLSVAAWVLWRRYNRRA